MSKVHSLLNYDYRFKVLLIGDSGVGKSSILARFTKDEFLKSTNVLQTVGIDFASKFLFMEDVNKRIHIQLWDTAGQERFQSITTAYYRGAMGVMMVYDVTDQKSFENISTWVRRVENYCDGNATTTMVAEKMILANKCDAKLDDGDREVSLETGMALANSYQLPFMEVSAKDNINIQESFLILCKRIMNRKLDAEAFNRQNPTTVSLSDQHGRDYTSSSPSSANAQHSMHKRTTRKRKPSCMCTRKVDL